MRTQKPISTISYNTEFALKQSLKLLLEKELIAQYLYIEHQPEKEGRKVHKHVLIVPNATIDTNSEWFKQLFVEPISDGEPLNVMPWQRSKEKDFVLYALHNPNYLAAKGLTRLYHYDTLMLKTNDEEWLEELLETALASSRTCAERMLDCARKEFTFAQAMIECQISYGSMLAFFKVYEHMVAYVKAERDQKQKAERSGFDFNPDTGEVKFWHFVNGVKIYD